MYNDSEALSLSESCETIPGVFGSSETLDSSDMGIDHETSEATENIAEIEIREAEEDTTDSVEDYARFSNRRYWESPEEGKFNRELVEEYDEKYRDVKKQMYYTAETLYEECSKVVRADPETRSRFECVALHPSFEIYDKDIWDSKMRREGVSIEQSGSILGDHSIFDGRIRLSDGELIEMEATHECIHSLSFCGEGLHANEQGEVHKTRFSGVRCIDLQTGQDYSRGLNEGLTQMYTEDIRAGQEDFSANGFYVNETRWARELRSMAGAELVDDAYFNGKVFRLENWVNEQCGSESAYRAINKGIDRYQAALSEGDAAKTRYYMDQLDEVFSIMRKRIGDDKK